MAAQHYMEEEKLYFPIWKSVKCQNGPLGKVSQVILSPMVASKHVFWQNFQRQMGEVKYQAF